MESAELIDRLGYGASRNFLRSDNEQFQAALDYGHVFRRAAEEPCSLKGVYVLRDDRGSASTSLVPLVYVCEAPNEVEANRIHRYVWNQDVVPFLFVNTPDRVRLYSGFRYRESRLDSERGVLQVLSDFNRASEIIEGFHADSIDSGQVWRNWGRTVTPEDRVDWRLLRNLEQLGQWLRKVGGLSRRVSRALIGKYVYLHYLRDRGILSREKLEGWTLRQGEVFGRDATLKGFNEVIDRLEQWLNGDVFPIPSGGSEAPKRDHLRRVAGTFAGDELAQDGSWQLHLDFRAYDFSYIPIETLSVVYVQLHHAPVQPGSSTKARERGAYYTPIPLVNFMLSELEARRPLRRGTRVFDPACGSGAFLAQCYRRLIEKEFPPTACTRPRPAELRDLLTRHIFGVDVDQDACSVTELSLILTLLDYVHPPDLENRPQFKLPVLRDQNIFCGNFFEDAGAWQARLERNKAGWIVGNPPWKRLKSAKLTKDDTPAWNWMTAKRSQKPVGGNQVAQAFGWEVARYLDTDGEIGLLLPAMTLFEDPSRKFRSRFFREMKVRAIANFSNLAEVLFAGRSRVPAAAVFYHPREEREASHRDAEYIRTYSPLVANQEATRPVAENRRNESWSLVFNASETRDIPVADVAHGNGLPWKLATWGSHLDRRLLEKVARPRRFPSLERLEDDGVLVLSEGLQLGREGRKHPEYVAEVVGKNRLDVRPLERLRHFFAFPSHAIGLNPTELCWGREGRVDLPLSICRPPHVIVSAARNFAVYTDEYLVVPPRQVGIVSPSQDRDFLKALSLYLSSDFAFYHQFLTSTQFGVQRAVATLRALRAIPVPALDSPETALACWVDLHGRLVKCSLEEFEAAEDADRPLFAGKSPTPRKHKLTEELNELVYDSLRLSKRERALVRDLVGVRLVLRDGMLGERATGRPGREQVRSYARRLKSELDAFVGEESRKRHRVNVVIDGLSGMVAVDFTADFEAARMVAVGEAGDAAVEEFKNARRRLRKEQAQWVYFDRNLRVYEGPRTFILKPMQRFHWTQSQAMFDAAEIVAETLAGPGERRS
jgi:hypothetical protein